MKTYFKQTLILLLLFLCCYLPSQKVMAAETTTTITTTPTYGQTGSRSMLSMINDFRKGNDAWYWNSSDTEKVVLTGLKEYTYDYNLEKIAMQRAAEVAVYWGHTRPNGSSWQTATTTDGRSWGENIAANTSSDPEDAFVQWQEINDKYSGQGHRRSMLSSSFTCVGIAHIYYNGYHFWVQEFGYANSNVSMTTALDDSKSVSFDVTTSLISNPTISTKVTSLSIPFGEEKNLPEATSYIVINGSWPKGKVPIEGNLSYTSGDSSIASASSGKITGKKTGSTNLTIASNDFDASTSIPVTVTPISLSSGSLILASSSVTYTGTAVEPTITSLTVNGKSLVKESDYVVTSKNNINTGTATLTITGKGNYKDSIIKEYTIIPKPVTDATINSIADQTYSGEDINPEITLSNELYKLGDDYDVKYENNLNAGSGKVTVTFKGNYKGTLKKNFTILAKPLTMGNIANVADQQYTGKAITPKVSATDGNTPLEENNDYELSYSNNINVSQGSPTIAVKGMGNYQGTIYKTFKITPYDIKNGKISIEPDLTYTGSDIKPAITVNCLNTPLALNDDYTVVYHNNINAGIMTGSYVLTGTGNYTGVINGYFTIKPKEVSNLTISAIPDQTYTGEKLYPDVDLNNDVYVKDTDYSLSYDDNMNAGTGVVTVSFKGNYTGIFEKTFEILPKSITKENIESISDVIYDGTAKLPEVKMKDGTKELEKGKDFTLSGKDNVFASSNAIVSVTGTGNYQGTISNGFTIKPCSIQKGEVAISNDSIYNGKDQQPSVAVSLNEQTLSKDTDYTIDYSNNINAGTGKLIITGCKNYTDTIEKTFTIGQKEVTDASILSIENQNYTGNEIQPDIILNSEKYAESTDYKISYKNNINAGMATAIVTFIGNYKGTVTQDFKILKKEIKENTVTVNVPDQTFSGSSVTPDIQLTDGNYKLVEEKDYTLSYKNNNSVGTGTVVVTLIGNYEGTITKSFIIKNPAPSQDTTTKVRSIELSGISKKVAAGKKIKLSATVYPNNAANQNIVWKSSNIRVATVLSDGTVLIKKGTGGKKVVITATADDGSGVTGQYIIISMKGAVKSVTIKGSKVVKAGKSITLKANVKAAKKANTKLLWTSSNTEYATVSSKGKVKTYVKGKGKTVKITAMATDGTGRKKAVNVKIK